MAKRSLPQRDDSRKSIDSISLAEITAYNIELLTKLKRLLAERRAEQVQPQPVPVKVKAAKLPTKRMTKRLTTFDAMSDAEQVDSIKSMWGQ